MTILQRKIKRSLLVVDDDEVMQQMLQKYLSSQFFSTTNLYDGRELPAILKKNRIDLIVLDVMLPDKSGLYWLKWLRMYHAHIPVIIASAKADPDDRLLGLENGARDYLVKPFQYKELLIRIEYILGSSSMADNVKLIAIGDMKLDTVMLTLDKNGNEIKLTELEADILKLMHINSGAVISRDDIMMQVRGTQHNPLDRSIDIHINNLRKKIEDCPAEPTYIRTVRGKGYRLHIPDHY